MSYVLAKSQNDDIHKAGECGGAVTSILKYLLDEGIVDGVLALSPQDDVYDATPTFITESDDLIKTCRVISLCSNNDWRPCSKILI